MNVDRSFSPSRRRAIQSAAALAGIAALGRPLLPGPVHAQATGTQAEQAPRFRFAFMPDFHLRREMDSPKGMAKALQTVNSLDPKPAFIVTGGDLIHDMRSQSPQQCEEMVGLFRRIWADNTDVPVHHTLGNHDIAGLTTKEFPRDHPLFGTNFLKEKLDMPGLNHSFNHGGWHFAVLHNVKVANQRVTGEFDEAALRFLNDDLKGNRERPTMLFGHYPPVTAIEFFNGEAKKTEDGWQLGYGRATRNPEALIEAIGDANVRAFLSGHIHRLDRIEAKGQTFICCGSVSGDQWRGPDVDTPAGVTVIDCHDDGRFDMSYLEYEAG